MAEFISNTVQIHIAKKIGSNYHFLVLKRTDKETIYPNLWQVITGTCNYPNETAIDTALREVYEETKIKPLKLWVVPFIGSFFDISRNKISSIPTFGILADGNSKVELSEEHSEYKWLTLNQTIDILPMPSHKEGTRYFTEYCLFNQFSYLFEHKI